MGSRALPRPPLLAGLALAALGLLGCEKISRVRECKNLARLSNATMDRIEADGKHDKPETYRNAAQRYIELAQAVRKLKLPGRDGPAAREDYALALESVGIAVRSYAETLGGKSKREQNDARRDVERAGRHERQAAGRIEAYCKAP